jgi:hypothetical protein
MPNHNPATDRSHGGPGSSHENPDKPAPAVQRSDSGGHSNHPPAPGEPTNPNRSERSGGGGERDKHHTHDPRTKS